MAVALKERRTVTGAEAIAERPDGTRIWFAAHPTPLYDERGGLIGGVNMLVDITERKEVELSLARGAREQGALYRFTARLQRAGTLDDIYGAALDAIIEGLSSDRAAILLVADDGVMRFVASRGLSGEYRGAVEGLNPHGVGGARDLRLIGPAPVGRLGGHRVKPAFGQPLRRHFTLLSTVAPPQPR